MSRPIHIVRLDGIIGPSPTFSIPHEYTEHFNTPPDPTIISSRLQDADVAIGTRVPITASVLAACPKLKLVAVLAVGCDHVDLEACKAHNVAVCNVPGASNESVPEHAIAMFFALRRNIVGMHEVTVLGEEWKRKGSAAGKWYGGMPPTCRQEVMCVIGAGELGNRVANIGRALGMKVIFAERKGLAHGAVREGRVQFEDALRSGTVFMITVPLEPSTQGLISAKEFSYMSPGAILINVARGGIVVEDDLVHALKSNQIAGAASDVYTEEPAGKENVLIKAADEEWAQGRLVLSPHLAWFAQSSMEKLRRTTTENVEAWSRGEAKNLVVRGEV